MRVHRLELTAFGPFAGTEVIDFDPLNESGFFLLTGPTGAGKTSVLDAICFGLFGAVPGVRNNAKDLKSHHAGPRDKPVVELELTLRERRFRFRRTPAWRRPSSRAKSGFVDENASVQAAELIDGQWVSRGTRLDEVGLLVTRLIGMSKEQFCQVVMLPQGQFETFLRAGAKERHDVLEALFHTGRFQGIERWLGEHRRCTEAASRAHEQQIHRLLAKAEEANGTRWYDSAASTADAAAGLATVVSELAPSVDTARSESAEAGTAAKMADHAHSEAELLGRRQAEYAAARRTLHELDSLRETVDGRAVRIARARSADRLSPILELLDAAAGRHAQAAAAAEQCLADAAESGAIPDATSSGQARAVADSLRTRAAELSAHGGIDEAIDVCTESISATETELVAATADLTGARDSLAAIPDLLAAARAELARASEQGARIDVLRLRHADAVRIHGAAASVPAIRQDLARVLEDERIARDRQLDARSVSADIREARIAGMAAHLAAQLRPGAGCPVCGSTEHPSPAESAGHVTEPDERAAAERLQEADDALAAARSHVTQIESRLGTAVTASAGVDEPTAMTAVIAATAAVESAREAAELATALHGQIEVLDLQQQAAHGSVLERTRARDTLQLGLDQQRRHLLELTHRRTSLLPEGGTVAAALTLIGEQLAAVEAWQSADNALRDAAKALGRHQYTFERKLAGSDFDDEEQLRGAVMSAADIATAEALNRTYADQRAVVLGRLDDPRLLEAARTEPPDLAALHAAAQSCQLAHETSAERYRRVSHRYDRLLDLAAALQASVDEWLPLEAARELAASVASMCAGTSADNQTRTRLSHYVLAARLQQVVDAANVRLLGISSGRYQLLHTMIKGVGDTRGGLGLRVLDTYTSQERDPATLSGGETFYVSLALALGLADLVRDEIGGAELSTLFVDEGFGSLDAETLDEVLDEVDSLRSGGRSVGLVSHLSELRRRIPTQVRIVSTPDGSTVSVI